MAVSENDWDDETGEQEESNTGVVLGIDPSEWTTDPIIFASSGTSDWANINVTDNNSARIREIERTLRYTQVELSECRTTIGKIKSNLLFSSICFSLAIAAVATSIILILMKI